MTVKQRQWVDFLLLVTTCIFALALVVRAFRELAASGTFGPQAQHEVVGESRPYDGSADALPIDGKCPYLVIEYASGTFVLTSAKRFAGESITKITFSKKCAAGQAPNATIEIIE